MKVVVVAATKGGVGKSTLATCLSVAAVSEGLKVSLIDCDPQGTLRDWHALRGSPAQPRLLDSARVSEAIREAQAGGADWVFVDTPPAVINVIEPAVRQADFVLVPVRPSPADLLGINPLVALCEEHDRAMAFVLTQVPLRTELGPEAARHLKRLGKVMQTQIQFRPAYASAVGDGRTGAEVDLGKWRAEGEIASLWQELKRLLRGSTKKVHRQ